MKRLNILYWVFTGLFAAAMLLTSIPDLLNDPEAIKFMNGHLQYPLYFIPFIGLAKVLGIVAVLLPLSPRIKEWAYAGLAFDLIGAIYSILAVDGFHPEMSMMLIWIGLGVGSYYFYHKKISRT